MTETQIGKYQIIEKIGAGTAGVVYRGQDPDIGRTVAIKVIKAEFIGADAVKQQAIDAFSSEIRAIGRLLHPNIVSIFDSGFTAEGLPYLVMQYVEGRSLDLILRDLGGALPAARALNILKQLSSAIDYAHSQKVVHRDIKPSNIIIAPLDHVYMVDFSTAIVANESKITSGQVVGTPQFMAPEVIQGEQATESADLYSLGIIAFYLFTGKRPFRDGNIADTFSAVLRQSAFSFAELGCPLGAKLERVLRRALAKDPADRFTRASEFIQACAKALESIVPDSFSQVAPAHDDSDVSKSGVFKIQVKEVARRSSFSKIYSAKSIMLMIASMLILASTAVGYLLFGMDIDSPINQAVRLQLGLGYTASDIKAMTDQKLMQIMVARMPSEIQRAAVLEAAQRDSADLANTVSTLMTDPRSEVRTDVIKALGLMKSLTVETRDYSLNKGLHDPDPFIRIFSATELARYQGKKATDAIKKQRELEQDVMVSKVLDFILLKL